MQRNLAYSSVSSGIQRPHSCLQRQCTDGVANASTPEDQNFNQSSASLREGDAVGVFSRFEDMWVEGKAVKFVGDSSVLVHYEVGQLLCRKILHIHSEHLMIPLASTSSSDEFHDLRLGESSQHWSFTKVSHCFSDRVAHCKLESPPMLSDEPVLFGDKLEAPLMQGHVDLPLDSGRCYKDLDFIDQMLASGDVVLVKGSWLLKLYRERQILPRRQELPPEAIWEYDDLSSNRDKVAFVAISHCWYFKDHPDPEGAQLQDIGPFIEAWFRHTSKTVNDIAIFWCWCSYFQEPRTQKQQEAFERILIFMHIWYINPHFDVWMLTYVPPDVQNIRQYEERGWTTWESVVSRLFMVDHDGRNRVPLDLCRRPMGLDLQKVRWSTLKKHLGYSKPMIVNGCPMVPPIDPDSFDVLIEMKSFTKGQQDCSLVKKNYRANFGRVMSLVSEFNFGSYKDIVDAREVQRLTHSVFPLCCNLQYLSFTGCKHVGNDGAQMLAAMLYHSSTIRILNLSGCNITDSGAEAIAEAVPYCPSLEKFILQNSNVTNRVRTRLRHACSKLKNYRKKDFQCTHDFFGLGRKPAKK